MFTHAQSMVKIDNQWYFGKLDKWNFKKFEEDIKEKDHKKYGEFFKLEEFVTKYWKKQKPIEYVLEKIGCQEIKILKSKPIEPDPNTWEAYWFRDLHPLCLACIHEKCKQSSHVVMVSCPQHKKIKVEKNEPKKKVS